MRIGSLFSGIGGIELGLETALRDAGHDPEVVWQVEINPFCRSVLKQHWPEAVQHEDVRSCSLSPVDLICGGFPCQDISGAGSGAGLAGSRSGLWYEFERIVAALRPEWVVVENVASGARRWVDAVSAALEQLGYETLPVPLSAADVGAPHLRRRIFIVAHARGEQLRKQSGRRRGSGRPGAPVSGVDGEAGAPADADGRRRQVERVETEKGLQGKAGREPDRRGGAPQDDQREARRPPADAVDQGLQGQSGEGHKGWSIPAEVAWADDTVPQPTLRDVDDGVPPAVVRQCNLDRKQVLMALGNAVCPQQAEVVGWLIAEVMACS